MSRGERRREAQGKGGSNMSKIYMILGAVAVIGVGVIGYSVGSGSSGAAMGPVVIEGIEDESGERDLVRLAELAQGVTRGDENATVTIIEFGDFQCPSCMVFAQQVKPQVDLALVETGKAKFVFYDFPITNAHPNAFLAARAARCADDQGRFWDYHDNLFRNQPRWSTLANAAGLFEEYARTLEMDDDAFAACLNSDRHAELVTANMMLGEVLGVGGTPTVLVEHGGSAVQVESSAAAIVAHVDARLASGSE